MTEMIDMPQYRDMAFVALMLGVSKQWVHRRVKDGELKAFASDGKLHIDMDSVRDYIKQREVKRLESSEPKKSRMQISTI